MSLLESINIELLFNKCNQNKYNLEKKGEELQRPSMWSVEVYTQALDRENYYFHVLKTLLLFHIIIAGKFSLWW